MIKDTSGTLAIIDSTISGNKSNGNGGGVSLSSAARVNVTNSTIANNRANGSGGGIATLNSSVARLNAVTVARNVADKDGGGGGFGGGLFQGAGSTIRVENTLVALNTVNFPGATGFDCYNETTDFDSQGHNLLTDDNGCTGFDGPGDLVRANPKLGQLADNGGPTKTIALRKDSPAIDRGGSDAPARDQRGVKRGGHPDIGAYERN